MRVKNWYHIAYEQGSYFRASQIMHFIVIHMFFFDLTENTAFRAWKSEMHSLILGPGTALVAP